MSVFGQTYRSYQYLTYSDFGHEQTRRRISRHYSRAAADRAFKLLRKVYSHERQEWRYEHWRCWQTDREGNIINDTNHTNKLIYA